MKKTLIVLAALCLMMTAVLSVSAAGTTVYGDVNGDGKVNNRDLGILQRYLNEWEIDIDAIATDMNGDGNVNNRDLGLLQQLLNA